MVAPLVDCLQAWRCGLERRSPYDAHSSFGPLLSQSSTNSGMLGTHVQSGKKTVNALGPISCNLGRKTGVVCWEVRRALCLDGLRLEMGVYGWPAGVKTGKLPPGCGRRIRHTQLGCCSETAPHASFPADSIVDGNGALAFNGPPPC